MDYKLCSMNSNLSNKVMENVYDTRKAISISLEMLQFKAYVKTKFKNDFIPFNFNIF